MSEISLPHHLIFPCLISALVLFILILLRKRIYSKWKWIWISSTLFFAIYLFIVAGASYSDIQAKRNLIQFDLNHDGLFTGDEITTDMKEAINRLTNDIRRNFSFISGLFFSAAISFMVFIGGLFLEFINLSKRH